MSVERQPRAVDVGKDADREGVEHQGGHLRVGDGEQRVARLVCVVESGTDQHRIGRFQLFSHGAPERIGRLGGESEDRRLAERDAELRLDRGGCDQPEPPGTDTQRGLSGEEERARRAP